MGTRIKGSRGAAPQPPANYEGKAPSDIVAIFALAYLRSIARAAARATEGAVACAPAAPPKPSNSPGNCLDDRRPVEASCERVEHAAVSGAESGAKDDAAHTTGPEVKLEAMW